MQTTPIVNLLVQTPVQMLQPYLTVYSMRSFEVILLDCPERWGRPGRFPTSSSFWHMPEL